MRIVRKRPLGILLVVGGVALTAGAVLSMVRTADGALSGDPDAVESALQTPPTTLSASSSAEQAPADSADLGEASRDVEPDEAAPSQSPAETQATNPLPPPSIATAPIEVRTGLEALRTSNTPNPMRLTIDAIDVDAPVGGYGVAATGQMDVPDNVTEVAWYEYGPSPGESGSAVLAAHVDLASAGPGVFFELREVREGDIVTVGYDDDSVRDFRVVGTKIYDKDELPLDAIFSRTGSPVLTLITCGGGFSQSTRSYDSNVVVYAVPVLTADNAESAALS